MALKVFTNPYEGTNIPAHSIQGSSPMLQGTAPKLQGSGSPAIISSSLGRTTTNRNLNYLNTVEKGLVAGASVPVTPVPGQNVPVSAPSPAPLLTVSSVGQGMQNVVGEINKLLQNPQVQAELTPELRSQIAKIQGLDSNINLYSGQAREAVNNNQITSFNSIIESIKKNQEDRNYYLSSLTTQLQPLREKYIASLAPTTAETDLVTQIADIQKKQKDFNLSLEEGKQKQFGVGRPLSISTGRANELERQAQFEKQQMQNEEANLLTRLGLAQEARRITSEGTKFSLDSFLKDRDFAVTVQNAQESRENQLFTQAIQLNNVQRQTMADILEAFEGTDPTKLSPENQTQLAQIASSRGIPYNLLFEGLQTSYDRRVVEDKLKQAQIVKATETDSYAHTQIENNLLRSRGYDGYANPSVFASERVRAKMNPDEFNKRFGYLLKPEERSALGVKGSTLSINDL